jgi:hypothetical protein
MSDSERQEPQRTTEPGDPPSPGPNLVLFYSLIALALIVAIGLALTIVMPFYHRH